MYVEYYLDQGGGFNTIKLHGKSKGVIPPMGAIVLNLRDRGDPAFIVSNVEIDFVCNYAKVWLREKKIGE